MSYFSFNPDSDKFDLLQHPSSLDHFQQRFAKLINKSISIEEALRGMPEIATNSPHFLEGLAIYQDNHIAWSTQSIRSRFPVLAAMLGQNVFRVMTAAYVEAFPMAFGDMNALGCHLPLFMEQHDVLKNRSDLLAMAILELAIKQSSEARNQMALDASLISQFTPEQLLKVRVKLAPSCQIICLPNTVTHIWHAYQSQQILPVQLNEVKPQYVLLCRPQWQVKVFDLTQAQWCFLCSLRDGRSVYDSLELLDDLQLSVDFSHDLVQWVANDLFISMQ